MDSGYCKQRVGLDFCAVKPVKKQLDLQYSREPTNYIQGNAVKNVKETLMHKKTQKRCFWGFCW